MATITVNGRSPVSRQTLRVVTIVPFPFSLDRRRVHSRIRETKQEYPTHALLKTRSWQVLIPQQITIQNSIDCRVCRKRQRLPPHPITIFMESTTLMIRIPWRDVVAQRCGFLPTSYAEAEISPATKIHPGKWITVHFQRLRHAFRPPSICVSKYAFRT
jgi:hypothetical protein